MSEVIDFGTRSARKIEDSGSNPQVDPFLVGKIEELLGMVKDGQVIAIGVALVYAPEPDGHCAVGTGWFDSKPSNRLHQLTAAAARLLNRLTNY